MSTTKAIITITLASGKVIDHKLDVSTGGNEVLLWATFYTNQLHQVLYERSRHAFIVLDPFIVYNRDHIASVSIDFVDSDTYNHLIQEAAPNDMGFRPEQNH